jgi:predicted CXXCH cytochrome family protein
LVCLAPGFSSVLPAADSPTTATTKASAIVLSDRCDLKRAPNCDAAECHPRKTGHRVISHPLYLENRCMECHIARDSPQVALVTAKPATVCLRCHIEVKWNSDTGTLAHPPGEASCTTCHNPHESSVRNLLRSEDSLAACAACHKDFLLASQDRPYRHRHFEVTTQCGSCHYAHRPGLRKYVREDTSETCLSCHNMPILTDGRTLPNIAREIAESPFKHKAIEEGGCPLCHTPHGSDQPALLNSGYPAANYAKYKTEDYALCWRCHSSSLVESKQGEGVTNFSNGAVNLHQKHVLDIGKGRACHVCHEAHAASQPHMLRQTLVFRSWTGPFTYTPLPDGGRCVTACHKEREYHRVAMRGESAVKARDLP